jgi:uncharacterized repeat protein (TIGR03847 family)
MADDAFDTGSGPALEAQRLRVEAIGEPGQRRFRLLAVVDGNTHVVWMEKQQLQALGLALEQLLEQLPDGGPDLGPANLPLEFDTETASQFRAGRMELGYDERRDRLVIAAHDMERDDDDDDTIDLERSRPNFACRLTRAQAREISADAAAVVSAGRPRCTMCGQPMSPEGHACPHMNGHLPLVYESVEDNDDLDS